MFHSVDATTEKGHLRVDTLRTSLKEGSRSKASPADLKGRSKTPDSHFARQILICTLKLQDEVTPKVLYLELEQGSWREIEETTKEEAGKSSSQEEHSQLETGDPDAWERVQEESGKHKQDVFLKFLAEVTHLMEPLCIGSTYMAQVPQALSSAGEQNRRGVLLVHGADMEGSPVHKEEEVWRESHLQILKKQVKEAPAPQSREKWALQGSEELPVMSWEAVGMEGLQDLCGEPKGSQNRECKFDRDSRKKALHILVESAAEMDEDVDHFPVHMSQISCPWGTLKEEVLQSVEEGPGENTEDQTDDWRDSDFHLSFSNDDSSPGGSPLMSSPSTSTASLPLIQLSQDDSLRQRLLFKKTLLSIWKMVAGHRYSGPFLKPVSEKQAPGYKDVVKRPVDLSSIKRSLSKGRIQNMVQFQRDLMLMFQNAIMYNSSNHHIHRIAVEMQHDVLEQLQMLGEALLCSEEMQGFVRRYDAPVWRGTATCVIHPLVNQVVMPEECVAVMALGLASPVGLLSDDEPAVSPVLESTVAECGAGLRKALLPDFSAISASPEQAASDDNGKVKVYARVRPLKLAEVEKQEDQGCVCIENPETLLLKAPKDSFTMRNTERGVGQAVHKFTFTKIFGPEVDQKSFFDATMKEVVKDVLSGQNWLVYTYGVTNSGKTYTIQGSGTDGGILPRSLGIIFSSIGTRLYRATDLKPCLSCEVTWLDSKQVRQEETKKKALLCGVLKEEELLTSLSKTPKLQAGTSSSTDSGIGSLSSTCHSASQTSSSQLEETGLRWPDPDSVSLLAQDDVQFSIWVSFFEIYNEMIYDLLEVSPFGRNRKGSMLRLCEDQTGNPYVKDLNWINVQDADEAWKLLKLGRRNQSFASTHMNQNSSRSHSIFSIRILHLQGSSGEVVPKISELSLCDLAGSERCKEQRAWDRMKEANNINTSLHTLGRCLSLLRQNQQSGNRLKQSLVPFRDSKLTRVFQGFFTGRGQSCMVVNINPCASSYDETLHVAKFSAIASQLVQAPVKMGARSIRALIKEHGIRTKRAPAAPLEEEEEEEEEETSGESEDEADMTLYDKEASDSSSFAH
ncbi:Kinesin-like protein KIF20A [Varanus komodoensis]|nr:Kinesin-like protein KIF20A [Varanus komodoensis]